MGAYRAVQVELHGAEKVDLPGYEVALPGKLGGDGSNARKGNCTSECGG